MSHHIDAPVLRFRDGNIDGDYNDAGDDVLYYTNDANMNVMGLVMFRLCGKARGT